MSKIKSFFTNILILFFGLLPVALALFTFLNLRLCKMPDNSMNPSVSKGAYVISIRKDVEDIEAGTLVVVNPSKEERIVRKMGTVKGDQVYVSAGFGGQGEWVSVDDIWGTVLFKIG